MAEQTRWLAADMEFLADSAHANPGFILDTFRRLLDYLPMGHPGLFLIVARTRQPLSYMEVILKERTGNDRLQVPAGEEASLTSAP